MGATGTGSETTGQPSLEAVTNLVLAPVDERLEPPVERASGPRPVRATLEGELAAMQASADDAGERACCLELAARLIDEDIDLDRAVRLLERALDITDDAALRRELAGHLLHMSRFREAATTLEEGASHGAPETAAAVLVEAAALYARAGDARAAEAALGRAATLEPESAVVRERWAAVGDWASQAVPPERAAELWLEASQRHAPGSDLGLGRLALACDIAPQHGAASAAFAEALLAVGRPEAADEVLRSYAAHAAERGRSVDEIHHRRVALCCALGHFAGAIGAAIDASAALPDVPGDRGAPLGRLLKRPEVNAYFGPDATARRRLRAELSDAARTKSRMGRATALAKAARRLPPDGRAELLAVAAESFAAAGNVRRAREAAAEAWQFAPSSGRVLSTLVAVSSDDDLDGRALELALDRLPARALFYRLLADRLEAEGHPEAAVVLTRRWVDHSAGSLAAIRALFERVARARDVGAESAVVGELLNLPLPVQLIAPDVATALRTLHDEQPDLALDLARDVLDSLGPGDGPLAELLTSLAEHASDEPLLRAIVVRRACGDGTTSAERAALMLRACRLDLAQARYATAATHLARAASLAADLGQLMELDEALGEAADDAEGAERSEYRIAHAHAKAWMAEQQDARTAAAQWRLLGALRWDLAQDRLGAEDAFFRACLQEPDRGPPRYASDLVDRAGAADALELMTMRTARLDSVDHRRLRARILAAAARVASEHENPSLALRLATDAVVCDPSRSDAVAIVERVASGDAGIAAIHKVYDTLAAAALGRFGERAAHYRAARQLEHRQAFRDGLRHAIAAFEAVPSSGAAYALLLRLAARCGEEETAVRSMASVAAAVPSESRIGWLQRAAEVARQAANAPALRYDLALNAFNVEPCGETVALLCTATEDLLHEQPNDPIVTSRFEHAVKVAMPRLEGPSGAYTAFGVAMLAARLLGDGAVACTTLAKALDCDPGGGGYSPMLPYLDVLASSDVQALALLEAIEQKRQDPYLVIDPSLEALFLGLAERVGYEVRPAAERAPTFGWADLGDDDEAPSAAASSLAEEPTVLAATSDLAVEPAERMATGSPAGDDARDRPMASPAPSATPDPEIEAEESDELALDVEEAEQPRTLPVGDLKLVRFAEQPPPAIDEEPDEPAEEAPIGASAELAAEEQARQRGDHAELARLLGLRAARTASLEMRRLVRLRLAALLEQRLGRLDEAALQLRAILEEQGDDCTTLRYLADVEERRGQPAEAAEMWLRASARARDGLECSHDLDRFAESLRALPDTAHARALLGRVGPGLTSRSLEALRAELDVADAPTEEQEVEAPSAGAPDRPAGDELEELRLEYLQFGPGDATHAGRVAERLRALAPHLGGRDRDLHAFLLAEALDAADAEDSATAELEDYVRVNGATPLVSLALAERLMRQGDDAEALELYGYALEMPAAIRQVRSLGAVAVDAAEAARRLGDGPRSVRLLELSTSDEATATVGRELLARWSEHPGGPAEHEQGREGAALADDERLTSRPELSSPRVQDLYDELLAGSYQAGEYLIALFEAELVRGRAREVAIVRQRQAKIRRGDPVVLSRLADAARADEHEAHARAVEHVLNAFGPAERRIAPPPLDALIAHPALTTRLLFAELAVGANEALALVADAGLLRRELSAYGLVPAHRVTASSDPPLGRLFAAIVRLLELPGFSLFHRLRAGPLQTTTALLTPLGTIVDGRVDRDDVPLRYLLGEAVAAAASPAALATGLSDRELHDVLVALEAAFGTAIASTEATAEQLRLAEDLWHVVTPAAERRLRDLCADQSELAADRVRARVRRACRRAGLFLSGDLGFAVSAAVAELGLPVHTPLDEPGGLAELCSVPAVAELVDLAISEEYAEVRWASRPERTG